MDDSLERLLLRIHPGWLVLIIGAALYLPFLATGALQNSDGAVMAQVGRSVLQDGRLFGAWLDKPATQGGVYPLVIWAIAGSVALLGDGELGVRLPFALCAALLPALVSLLTLRLTGSRAADLWAGLLVLASSTVFTFGLRPVGDLPAACLTVGAFILLAEILADPPRRVWTWGVLLGLVSLCKLGYGAIPAAGAGLFVLLAARGQLRLPSFWAGAAAVILVPASHLGVLLGVAGSGVVGWTLDRALLSRFAGRLAGHGEASSGPLYYLGALFNDGAVGPIVLLLAAGWLVLWARRREPGQTLLGSWLVISLVAVSAAGTRLPQYLLLVLVPASVAAAWTLSLLPPLLKPRLTTLLRWGCTAVLLAAVPVAALRSLPTMERPVELKRYARAMKRVARRSGGATLYTIDFYNPAVVYYSGGKLVTLLTESRRGFAILSPSFNASRSVRLLPRGGIARQLNETPRYVCLTSSRRFARIAGRLRGAKVLSRSPRGLLLFGKGLRGSS